MADWTGGKLAAEALIKNGVEVIFTLSGGHITPIYQHLENSPIRLFDTRHEQAAVFMAEAYGRMMRKPGVAMVTAGPGFTNALSAIANAKLANSPLLLISGCVGVNCCEKLDLQDMRQAPVIEPMVKKAFVCHTASRVFEFVDMAYRTAMTGRPGPVYLELPVDVLNTPLSSEPPMKVHCKEEARPVDLEGARKLVDLLKASKKPMFIAGSGAWYSDAGKDLTLFAEKAGVPIFTAAMGRGTISDTHPLCFESAVGVRPGATLFAQTETDLIVFLGGRVSLYYLFGELWDQAAKIVQVDILPEEIGRNRPVDLAIQSDIRELMKACNRLIDEQSLSVALHKQFAEWRDTLTGAHAMAKESVASNLDPKVVPIHPMLLAKEIDDFLDKPDDIVVADGGDTQIWMGMSRTARTGGKYLDSGLYGCLGVGIPFSNAAKLTNPKSRVCCIIGDGSVGFNFMEFETAVRKGLPIVVVISNDLGWGMIRHSQELRLGHAIPDGTHIGFVPYHLLVEALGGKGYLVEKPEDIRPVLEEAFASGKTVCINVMTDTTTISPGSIALASVGAYKG